MKRRAFKMFLKEGYEEEYEKRHKNIWPELKKLLKESGVNKYSIFLDKESNLLFTFQEISDDSGSQNLAQKEVLQKWWDYMKDIMHTNEYDSPVSVSLHEVFFWE